jgi:hypothetical protein
MQCLVVQDYIMLKPHALKKGKCSFQVIVYNSSPNLDGTAVNDKNWTV